MDKFGVFKLLNSFLDFYKSNPNAFKKPEANISNPESPAKQEVKEVKNFAPLREQMLATSKNHELIVRRVMEKNNAQKNNSQK